MKIIIFEGIATSGKTSIIEALTKTLTERKVGFSVISEVKTLLPLLDNTDKHKSIKFLKRIIKKAVKEATDKKNEFLIFDRLYFTHIFRTNCTIEDFREIENLIKDNAILVFLKIDESKIRERINRARKHRDKEWNEYVGKKGSEDEANDYYISQQRFLLKLASDCKLKRKVYNTSDLNFDRITEDILDYLKH
jgi:thymidylate kinase